MSFLQGPFQTVGFVLDKVNVIGTCFLLQGKLGRISPEFLEQVPAVHSERNFVAVGRTEVFRKRSFFRVTDEGGGAEVSEAVSFRRQARSELKYLTCPWGSVQRRPLRSKSTRTFWPGWNESSNSQRSCASSNLMYSGYSGLSAYSSTNSRLRKRSETWTVSMHSSSLPVISMFTFRGKFYEIGSSCSTRETQ